MSALVASADSIRCRARQLAYLNDTEKIMNALIYEYGRDHRLPTRGYVQQIVDRYRAGRSLNKSFQR